MGTDERGALRFRLLGPLEVWRADQPLALGGERQRALLALLLVHANELLSADRLVDELIGSRRYQDGVNAVRVMIARLRRALGEEPPVHTRSGGYVLKVAPEQLDCVVFEQRLARARQLLADGDAPAAQRCAADALDLWRGEPFADLQGYVFLQPEIRRLVDLRLLAVTERIEAELAGGAGPALVPELKRLVDANPLEERLRRQLMTALYRAGRQSEALEVYGQASALLRDELGLQPSPELQELQRAVLNHDPALRSQPDPEGARPHLPRPTTPFLGRERELGDLRAIMARAETRLVTLTGAGGSGKTRLALRVAEDSAPAHEDGVWFVGFADVTDAHLIAATICTALDVTDQTLAPLARVKTWCRERHVLLLLDNLEQLAEGSAVLAELLAQCPRLKLLVTSREPLHLAGEHQYEVPVLREDEAIELFTRRACAVTASPNVNLKVVPEICRRLDYLPLALELAAARQKLLSTEEILDRLTRGLPTLARGPRDAPRRQQTLRATIDWSYELLDPEAQSLFASLGVFAGGCTFDGAEKVCGATLDGLQALVDRSLIRSDGGRFWMLQTLREYALERLAQTGREAQTRAAHAAYMIDFLHQLGLDQRSSPTPDTHCRLSLEIENFRAALVWAKGAGEAETLARIVWPLTHYWLIRQGHLDEAERWVTEAMRQRDQYPSRIQGEVLVAARAIAHQRGDYQRALALAEEGLDIWRALDDRERIGEALMFRGNRDRAATWAAHEEAIAYARQNNLSILGNALVNASDTAIKEGRLEEGRAFNEEALNLSDGPQSIIGTVALINLAHIANLEQRFVDGLGLALQSADAAVKRGDRATGGWAVLEASWSLAEMSEFASAARLLGAALEFIDRAGMGRQWMDDACVQHAQAAMGRRFDSEAIDKMVAWGRRIPLEQAVRDALDATPPAVSRSASDIG